MFAEARRDSAVGIDRIEECVEWRKWMSETVYGTESVGDGSSLASYGNGWSGPSCSGVSGVEGAC